MRLLLSSLVLLATAAYGGPDALDGHDDGPDEGLAYWGFVKDQSGVPVRDAKVSATHKNLTLVTRSTATGAYRVKGFKKDVRPEEVVISCSKEGYRQIRVFRYPAPKGKPVKSVETECRLQREKS
jgi:hypothetical protein